VTRLGLVFAGDPRDPWEWSGIPHAILRELAALGHDPAWVDARPNTAPLRAARRAVVAAHVPVGVALRSGERPRAAAKRLADAGTANAHLLALTAAVRARRAAAPTALVQIRGDLLPVPGARTAILEDITVAKVAEHRSWAFAHGAPQGLTRRRIAQQRRAHHRAAASCPASHWCAASLRDDYGIDPARIHVVGFGAEPLAAPAERDWSVPRLLWIGLDWERKGGDAVVRAFRALRDEHPRAELHLVGNHPRVDVAGVAGHGRLDRADPGQRARLAHLLERATALVLPSTIEPFGIVYVEAGLAGVPSVGTTVGGAGTAIGAGGLLVTPGDAAQLGAALARLAAPEAARALGAGARVNAAQFTWRKVTERLVRALAPGVADARGYADFVAGT
jgi:glycosyltransferase involved in cell wall biosynthesis